MGSLIVDPSEVHSITVDPSDVSAYSPQVSSSPIADQFSGIGRSLGNLAKSSFDTLTSLVDPAMAEKLGNSVLDAHIDQWHQAKDEYAKGNYGAALTRGLGAVVPFLGPLINNASAKMTSGKPGAIAEGATDLIAPALLLKAAETAPEVASAVKEHVGNFVDVVKGIGPKAVDLASHPKVMATAGAAGGAAIGGPVGAAIGGLGGKALADAIADIKTTPPPEILDRLGLTAKDYRTLPEDGKAQIRELSQSMLTPKPSRPAPAQMPPAGPIPIGEASAPSRSLPQQIDEYIAQRKAAAQPPAQPVAPRTPVWAALDQLPDARTPETEALAQQARQSQGLPSGRIPGRYTVDVEPAAPPQRVPLWQQQGNQPAVIPEGPANPTVAPQPRVIAPAQPVAETPTPEVSTGIHPPAEAYEGTYRAKRAQILADHMHQAGIEYGDSANMTPASLTDQQWETLLGKDPETGVQYRKPSQKTIDQARVRLAHKYAAGRNAASADAAKALADEMAQGDVQQ